MNEPMNESIKEDLNEKIKNLMIEAIEEKRPDKINEVCLDIWNQPFFYKIDKAKALTISYAPTDKGARTNYPYLLEKHKINPLSSEEIFKTLYSFIPEPHFRRNYNTIFQQLGIQNDMVAHMDISSFPYLDDKHRQTYRHIDNSYKYPLRAIEFLSNQLEYILIDGKDNKEIVNKYFSKDYVLYLKTNLPINKSERPYELSIFKHKTKNITLMYYGCFLWGETRPNKEYVLNLAKYINENTPKIEARKFKDIKEHLEFYKKEFDEVVFGIIDGQATVVNAWMQRVLSSSYAEAWFLTEKLIEIGYLQRIEYGFKPIITKEQFGEIIKARK